MAYLRSVTGKIKAVLTPDMRQSKTQQLANADQKSLERVFSIDICRLLGEKWQSKILFLTIFDLRSPIVFSVFDCRLSGVILFA